MSEKQAAALCICCPVYRPVLRQRIAEQPMVCEVCRWRVPRDVHAIARLHWTLSASVDDAADRRQYAVLDEDGRPTGQVRWRDGVSAMLPAGAVASRVGGPVVSGSRASTAPADLDIADLTGPVNHSSVRDLYGDQVGYVSAATILDGWVRVLRDELFPHERLPGATVPQLTGWLTAGDPVSRLDIACSRFAAMDEMMGELRGLLSAMRSAAGETEPRPHRYWGVPCRGCNVVSLLVQAGEFVECEGCWLLLTLAEFQRWMVEAAGRWGPGAADGSVSTDTEARRPAAPPDGTTACSAGD